jgi:hypothetical protein
MAAAVCGGGIDVVGGGPDGVSAPPRICVAREWANGGRMNRRVRL